MHDGPSDAGAKGPAVIVLQEWWGLNDQIKGVADRFARAGFSALVPDLYRGSSTTDAEEAHHLMSNLDFSDAASQDVVGAVQFAKGHHAKVGLTGFCMGGALTLLASMMTPDLDAACTFYGHPPVDYINAEAIKIPVIGHWATQDVPFPIEGVDALEAKLAEGGVNYTGYRYLAQHGFTNETAQGPGRIPISQYDAAWAQLAYDRTFAFFGRTLA
jgi:carboxymethylenebutenolidase